MSKVHTVVDGEWWAVEPPNAVEDPKTHRIRQSFAAIKGALADAVRVTGHVAVPMADWEAGQAAVEEDDEASGCAAVYAAVCVPLDPRATAPPTVGDCVYGGIVPPGFPLNVHRNNTVARYAAVHAVDVRDALPAVDVHMHEVPAYARDATQTTRHIVWMSGTPNDPAHTSPGVVVDAPRTNGDDHAAALRASKPMDVLEWKTVVNAANSRSVRADASWLPSGPHLALMLNGARDGTAAAAALARTSAGVPRAVHSGTPVPCGVSFVGNGGTAVRVPPRNTSVQQWRTNIADEVSHARAIRLCVL